MENTLEKMAIGTMQSEVISIRNITNSTYVLRFYRNQFEFQAGQYLVLGLPGSKQKREYSIYSSVTSPYLEVIIKEIDKGLLSKKFKTLAPGDKVEIEGPFGYFVIDDRKIPGRKFLFIASGTGISPFHSLILSSPHLNYTLLHGVRTADEGYDRDTYEAGRYILCLSRGEGGDFKGRVTEYLKKHPVDHDVFVYLCGNSAMIDDVYSILEQQGFPSNQIHAEVYF